MSCISEGIKRLEDILATGQIVPSLVPGIQTLDLDKWGCSAALTLTTFVSVSLTSPFPPPAKDLPPCDSGLCQSVSRMSFARAKDSHQTLHL